jgi:F0F1-type ATP synthase assembly protein I
MAEQDDPGEDERGLSSLASGYRKAAPYLGASSSLVGGVVGLSLLGYWLDGKVGNEKPWFFISGALLGMVGGFIGFFRTVLGMNRGDRR